MEIKVELRSLEFPDTKEVREKLLFKICWEHQGLFYPSEHWIDFGCIVLGWWVTTVIKLLRGDEKGSFAFMERPYSLSAKLDRSNKILTLEPRGTNNSWRVNLTEFVGSLAQAVNIVYEELVEKGVDEEDKDIFRKYAKVLQESLSELKKN